MTAPLPPHWLDVMPETRAEVREYAEEFAKLAVREALDQAAGLCDRFANRMMTAEECADAIRAAKTMLDSFDVTAPQYSRSLYLEAADELERLTPTEEERNRAAQIVSDFQMSIYPQEQHAAALLRKYVLREKQQAEPVQTTKEAWWAGYRAGKGLPADTPRQEALAAPPADDEAVRLLREARWYVEMMQDRPQDFAVLKAIDAYLAKKC